jgi:hypothetical protein
MKVKVIKNKVAPAINKVAEFQFKCAVGTDAYLDLIGCSKDLGLIRFAGSAVKWTNPETQEIETLCTGGKNGIKQALLESTPLFDHLKALCTNKESTYLVDIKNQPSVPEENSA